MLYLPQRLRWSALPILLVLLSYCRWSGPAVAAPRSTEPIRGVWVANVGSGVLSSSAKSQEFVDLCARCGVNTLFVVVWNRGQTIYPSDVMQQEFGVRCDPRYAGRDALKDIIDAAHAKNLRVFAWFEFGFSSSYHEPDGGHILRARPAWAARDVEGKLVSKNGFQWMNGFHSEVQEFMLSLMREVAEKYDVDGVQGDDRLPANPSTAGYDDWTVARYQQEHNGRRPPTDHLQKEWITWRANRLNRFAERMYRDLKAIEPELVVSAAPSIYPWSKQEYLQDWPTWVANGWVDVICPQIYRDNLESYRHELDKIVTRQVARDKLGSLYPGVLVQTNDGYRTTDALIEQMVAENRRRGIAGEVIFYDAGVTKHRALFERIYQTEIRRGNPLPASRADGGS